MWCDSEVIGYFNIKFFFFSFHLTFAFGGLVCLNVIVFYSNCFRFG